MYLGIMTKYLPDSLWGSVINLNSHSKPLLCIHLGACFFIPPIKSKAAPTQKIVVFLVLA